MAHIAASAKGPKKVDDFVRNLVIKMEKDDLKHVNNNGSTALYLAAAAGNLESVKIMMEKNPTLDTIPGGDILKLKMPLYAAALFGNKDVVSYLYERSKDLDGDRGWNEENRTELLEKCVEGDMFDIAIEIVKRYRELGRSGDLLAILSRKPEAFNEKKSSNTESNIIGRTTKSNIAIEIVKKYPKLGRIDNLLAKPEAFHEKKSSKNTESNIIRRTIKSNIVKLPKLDVDRILEGPPDSIQSRPGRIIQSIQLKELIFNHRDKLMEEAEKIRDEDGQRALKLKKLVSKHIVNLHVETQSLIKQENTTDEDQALELQKLISQYIVKIHILPSC
ncbi:ankyrin repeat-containing domain, PGG domain protein [Tanacetum coccineum]